jgi:hypothetical protein
VVDPAVAALRAVGVRSGVAVLLGDARATVVPVFEGRGLSTAAVAVAATGAALTDLFAHVRSTASYFLVFTFLVVFSPFDLCSSVPLPQMMPLHATLPRSVVAQAKEALCFVSLHYDADRALAARDAAAFAEEWVAPDGRVIRVTEERFRCGEVRYHID